MLRVLSTGQALRKSTIAQKCGLCFATTFKKTFQELLSMGLISESEERNYYDITKHGLTVLRHYFDLLNLFPYTKQFSELPLVRA